MEKIRLNVPVKVICVSAGSFPAGIKTAHEKLHSLLPSLEGRRLFGISWGSGKGNIIYKAAVEELYEGEAEKYNCERFVIRDGNYTGEILRNWRSNEQRVSETFMKLLSAPGLLENGYCVEEYINENDMLCMVTMQ